MDAIKKMIISAILMLLSMAMCCVGIWLTLDIHLAFIPMIVAGSISFFIAFAVMMSYWTER